jgi:formamidopyrimidine-DNA glycosylase
MPELPEVETIRRDLEPHLLGRRIVGFHVADVRARSKYRRLANARNQTIRAVSRRGKYLLVSLGDTELVVHLGMSGRLFLAESAPMVKHRRAVLDLSDGSHLVFVDRRRFGTLQLVEAGDYSTLPTLARMGPEPLSTEFAPEPWVTSMARANGSVKALLLSQRLVAGIGNIYADEALHRARIHPLAHHLGRRPALRLHQAIRDVLSEAIAHRGTTFSLHRDGLMNEGDFYAELRVFGQTGTPCRRCETPIVKVRVAGRGTHLCTRCQQP